MATIMRPEYIPRDTINLANIRLVNNSQFISWSKNRPKRESALRGAKTVFKEQTLTYTGSKKEE